MTCRFCNGFGYVVVLPSTFSEGGRATCGNCLPEHLRNTNAVVSHETPLDVTQAADRIAELEARVRELEGESPVENWREIEQAYQPRLSEGYTAVKMSRPGFWMVKGPGPAVGYGNTQPFVQFINDDVGGA